MNYKARHAWFSNSFEHFPGVPEEIKDALWNYLAFGLSPGSFTTAVLRNDFIGAATRAHPALSLKTFNSLAKWLVNHAPPGSWGNDENMEKWTKLSHEERMDILIEVRLHPNEFDVLRGVPA